MPPRPVRSRTTKPSPLEEKTKGISEGGGVVEALLHPVAERALSSVLQNVFDAWMTLLGQPLQPISEY